MLSLKTWAAINLSYEHAINLEPCALSVFSIAMIEAIDKMNIFENREGRNGLRDVFIEKEKHACRITSYQVRGMVKEADARSTCWCYCPGGSLCNCGCGALLTLLMEFRENQRWRTRGPNIPQINLKGPIKSYLFHALRDPQLFYNVRRR